MHGPQDCGPSRKAAFPEGYFYEFKEERGNGKSCISVGKQPASSVGIQRVLRAMRLRTTSRQDDETICIATALGLDPKPLLSLPPDARMVEFLKGLPCVPLNLLFGWLSSSRMTREGFRWAPASLLNADHVWPNLIIDSTDTTWRGELFQRPHAGIFA